MSLSLLTVICSCCRHTWLAHVTLTLYACPLQCSWGADYGLYGLLSGIMVAAAAAAIIMKVNLGGSSDDAGARVGGRGGVPGHLEGQEVPVGAPEVVAQVLRSRNYYEVSSEPA